MQNEKKQPEANRVYFTSHICDTVSLPGHNVMLFFDEGSASAIAVLQQPPIVNDLPGRDMTPAEATAVQEMMDAYQAKKAAEDKFTALKLSVGALFVKDIEQNKSLAQRVVVNSAPSAETVVPAPSAEVVVPAPTAEPVDWTKVNWPGSLDGITYAASFGTDDDDDG